MNSKRLPLLVTVLCMVLPTLASATGLSVSPGSPTTADTLNVRVGGGFANMCWNPGSTTPTCQFTQPDTLDVTMPINYCGGKPECVCGQFPMSYSRTCKFGPMPIGIYVARFTELHINPADPLPTVVHSVTFAVSDATPTVHATWGTLKLIYR